MMKRWLFGLVMLGFLSMCIIACAGNSDANASGSTSEGSNVVHTQGPHFAQSSITLTKGSMLTLIDDDSTFHIIDDGSWVNGTPKSAYETGAPTVNNLQLSNNGSVQIGPFNIAGTYHLYCTIHQNMNLIVQVR